ncbi:hypothetical protein [Lichenibacterium ramalinae]|uniref:hypothetical protein n=1 Tax=Lichenibacterium ramalinae TaxID=2316527 RepID=UPI0013ECE08F|nr:hypothetical protein [Lichenibacterium ramalinae]
MTNVLGAALRAAQDLVALQRRSVGDGRRETSGRWSFRALVGSSPTVSSTMLASSPS